jgi:hypothetical protein
VNSDLDHSIDRRVRKLPRMLFPLIALPLYPVLVLLVANLVVALFTRPIPPLLPRLDTLLAFPLQLPWCLFTLAGVVGAMLLARLPGAGFVLAGAYGVSGWLFFRTLRPDSGRGWEITDIIIMSATVAVSVAYTVTAPLLVAAYRRFFLPPPKHRASSPPAATPGVYDY